jgi:hypothetical protein
MDNYWQLLRVTHQELWFYPKESVDQGVWWRLAMHAVIIQKKVVWDFWKNIRENGKMCESRTKCT